MSQILATRVLGNLWSNVYQKAFGSPSRKSDKKEKKKKN